MHYTILKHPFSILRRYCQSVKTRLRRVVHCQLGYPPVNELTIDAFIILACIQNIKIFVIVLLYDIKNRRNSGERSESPIVLAGCPALSERLHGK